MMKELNQDPKTIESFGKEWAKFDQSTLGLQEHQKMFEEYFSIFPWEDLPKNAVGLDVGCGSGRWAVLAAERVGHLHCLDASSEALQVAARTLASHRNITLHCGTVDKLPFEEASLDFCYALGVLHHVPQTAEAIRSCAKVLKPGAPLLLYLYYAMDNRPRWFRVIWRLTDACRAVISKLPDAVKTRVTDLIAILVYWPLARIAGILECAGLSVNSLPLSHYRNHSLYTMRTDSRDRFGTPLEQRFSLEQIREMMTVAGMEKITHSPNPPYWCVMGIRRDSLQ